MVRTLNRRLWIVTTSSCRQKDRLWQYHALVSSPASRPIATL